MKIMAMVIINEVEKETEKAILVQGYNKAWIPKSLVTIYRHKVMGFLNVFIPIWIAKNKGLLGFNDKGQQMYQLYNENDVIDTNEFELVN